MIPILNWIYGKLATLSAYLFKNYSEWKRQREEKAAIEAKNKAIKENTLAAKTKEERDAAARDIMNDI